jgi:hypothetical protein
LNAASYVAIVTTYVPALLVSSVSIFIQLRRPSRDHA